MNMVGCQKINQLITKNIFFVIDDTLVYNSNLYSQYGSKSFKVLKAFYHIKYLFFFFSYNKEKCYIYKIFTRSPKWQTGISNY